MKCVKWFHRKVVLLAAATVLTGCSSLGTTIGNQRLILCVRLINVTGEVPSSTSCFLADEKGKITQTPP